MKMGELSIKITGLNNFEFFVGFESVWHDQALDARKIGVKVEKIKTNFRYDEITNNIDRIHIYQGSIDKDLIATKHQIWCLGRYIVNELRSPIQLTAGITVDMCA